MRISDWSSDVCSSDLAERNILEILLYDDESLLEEVAVVAFGTQKKSSMVSSVTSVSVKDLNTPASNLTSSFAGRIPGVISYQTTGEPGADNAQFFIRGVTTFGRSEEHTSELQSLMRISYAVFCLKKTK